VSFYRSQKGIGFSPCGENYVSKRFGLLRMLGLVQPGKPGRPRGAKDSYKRTRLN
jgi:hypothetical protein